MAQKSLVFKEKYHYFEGIFLTHFQTLLLKWETCNFVVCFVNECSKNVFSRFTMLLQRESQWYTKEL